MGTLSGGGNEVISIGERCLLGANAGHRHQPRRRLHGRGRPLRHRGHADHAARRRRRQGPRPQPRQRPAVPPQLQDRHGRGAAALGQLGRPQRGAARERLTISSPSASAAAPRRRAEGRASATSKFIALPRTGTATSGSSPITNAAGSSVTARPLRTRSRIVEMSLISNAGVRSRPAAANARSEMIRVPQPGGVSASGSPARSASVTHSRAASRCSVGADQRDRLRRQRRQRRPRAARRAARRTRGRARPRPPAAPSRPNRRSGGRPAARPPDGGRGTRAARPAR